MISTELKKSILDALNLDDWEFDEQTLASQVPGWDSLSHVNVILAVEKRFKVRFSNIEVLRMKNVGDLQRLVDSKANQRP
jgi:acyl carrier protein